MSDRLPEQTPEPGQAAEPEPPAEPEPFADGPPPLPTPMLALGGDEMDPGAGAGPQVATAGSVEVEAEQGPACSCGGSYDPDGWCTRCGTARPDPRDHHDTRPAEQLAGVCDRGRRHTDNEDAMAAWADPADPGGRMALVVCDGVSSSPRSAQASEAAAGAAGQTLTRTVGEPAGARIVAAVDAAARAVTAVAHESADEGSPACTIVAGLIEDGLLTVGSVGDSRAYWLPQDGDPVRLTDDDSLAQEQIRAGVDRTVAEAGPLAHTITRWLGADAPDHTPVLVSQDVSAPGWVLLCTDGLWNYASEAADLARVVDRVGAGPDPLALGRGLVAWANEQGGSDNITVVVARTGGVGGTGQDGDHG